MLMIGVMPLPALMKRSERGGGSGSVKSPSTPPSRTIVPGRATRTRYGDTLPVLSSFGVIEMNPSGRPGSEVSEYARQWCTPSTTTPTRRYWPGSCPSHTQPGRITTVTLSGVSRSIDSIRPRSSRLDHNGLISSR